MLKLLRQLFKLAGLAPCCMPCQPAQLRRLPVGRQVGPAYLPAKGDGPQQCICCMQDARLQRLGQAGVGPIALTTDCSSSCTTLCRWPGGMQATALVHAARYKALTHGGNQASKAIWAMQLKLWCRHQRPGRVQVCGDRGSCIILNSTWRQTTSSSRSISVHCNSLKSMQGLQTEQSYIRC